MGRRVDPGSVRSTLYYIRDLTGSGGANELGGSAMRNVILQMSISLDGVVAAPLTSRWRRTGRTLTIRTPPL
jgi:hypothetical protein